MTAFEKWYKSLEKQPYFFGLQYGTAKLGWDACKKEVLNLIKNQKVHIMPEDEFNDLYLDRDDLIDKIEKL